METDCLGGGGRDGGGGGRDSIGAGRREWKEGIETGCYRRCICHGKGKGGAQKEGDGIESSRSRDFCETGKMNAGTQSRVVPKTFGSLAESF